MCKGPFLCGEVEEWVEYEGECDPVAAFKREVDVHRGNCNTRLLWASLEVHESTVCVCF